MSWRGRQREAVRKMVKIKVGILLITKLRNMEDSICCVVTTDDRGRRRRKEDEREEDTAQHEYVNLCCYESAQLRSQSFLAAYRMQNIHVGGRPGPFYCVNDVNVYILRQSEEGSPVRRMHFYAHMLAYQYTVSSFPFTLAFHSAIKSVLQVWWKTSNSRGKPEERRTRFCNLWEANCGD